MTHLAFIRKMARSRIIAVLVLSAAMLCGTEEKKREETVEIRVVAIAGSDSAKKENRLLVLGQSAYRTIEALMKALRGFSGHPEVHIVIYGACDASAPRLSSGEIETIRQACAKAGVQFTFYPAG
jgi:hypothetical protein